MKYYPVNQAVGIEEQTFMRRVDNDFCRLLKLLKLPRIPRPKQWEIEFELHGKCKKYDP